MRINKIEVLEHPNSKNVIYKFSFIEQLIAMNYSKNWKSSQIVINNKTLTSWSKLDNFIF